MSVRDFVGQGLGATVERVWLVASLGLAGCYLALILWFQAHDVPIDKAFYAQRAQVRIAYVVQHPLDAGRIVNVVEGGVVPRNVVLLDGWSGPETGGIWTLGHHAAFAVATPLRGPLLLRLWVQVKRDAQGEQPVRVSVGGHVAGAWIIDAMATELDVPVAQADIGADGLLSVRLDIGDPTPASPPFDLRPVGVYLAAMMVLRAPA